MKLTEKAKIDFEKWIYNNIIYCNVDDVYNWFLEIPFTMQFGVYIDWADSIGIYISMNSYDKEYWYNIEPNKIDGVTTKTRNEAREKAIIKLNELYNKYKIK